MFVSGREGGRAELRVWLNGELFEELSRLNRLHREHNKQGCRSEYGCERVSEGAAAYGAMKIIWGVKEV